MARVLAVFGVALRLGLTSFGGPVAHIAFFEREYVVRRGWATREHFASLVSLCQLLPGPTSSQVGFLVGRLRAGWPGALAAWLGFTLPSAILMLLAAQATSSLRTASMQGPLHGLMLAAVVVVAQAVWSMAGALWVDPRRVLIALYALAVGALGPSNLSLLATFAGGSIAGGLWLRPGDTPPVQVPAGRTGMVTALVLLAVFVCLGLATLISAPHSVWGLAASLYRTGGLVFGGGHVVLPLLQQALVPDGWVSEDQFLAAYGAAQLLPGPLFSVAAFIGAVGAPLHQAVTWALLALLAMFLPGLLLAAAAFQLFGIIQRHPIVIAIVAGMNAAVVGMLASALVSVVIPAAVHGLADTAVVLGVLGLALVCGLSSGWLVALCVVANALLTTAGGTS